MVELTLIYNLLQFPYELLTVSLRLLYTSLAIMILRRINILKPFVEKLQKEPNTIEVELDRQFRAHLSLRTGLLLSSIHYVTGLLRERITSSLTL